MTYHGQKRLRREHLKSARARAFYGVITGEIAASLLTRWHQDKAAHFMVQLSRVSSSGVKHLFDNIQAVNFLP
jgi:hypothetical protein